MEFTCHLKRSSGRCTIAKHVIECTTKIPLACPPRRVSTVTDTIERIRILVRVVDTTSHGEDLLGITTLLGKCMCI
jgi:hypothetical protein